MSDSRFIRIIAAAVILNTAFTSQAADDVQTPQQILAQVDKVRNPAAAFAVNNIVTEYENGRATSQAGFVIYSKLDSRTSQYRNLVGYVAPTRDAGKILLMNNSAMWFYDPNSRESIRISPQQRLIGGASNADVLSLNLAQDYIAGSATPDSVVNAAQQLRLCWRLDLRPSRPEAAYGRIEYWIDRETNFPVKGRFYAESSRLLKTIFYSDYKPVLGGLRPTKITIIDQLDATHVTTMKLDNYRLSEFPNSYFEREYLPRVRVR